MNKLFFVLAAVFTLWFGNVFGQIDGTVGRDGNIQVFANPRLEVLLNNRIEDRLANPTLKGYRIQISFEQKSKPASEAREKFQRMFPGTEAYLSYQAPNYRVRVGDFRSYIEAQQLFYQLVPEFSGVLIVEDTINLPPL